MKLLYCGILYNYGKPEEGFSYEHLNIERGLIEYCSFHKWELDLYYPDVTNDLLDNYTSVVLNDGYDAIFHVAFNGQFDLPESLAKLALQKDIPIIQWDSDASYRFKDWILPRKDRVSHFITTHSTTIPWYKACNMNVIKSQWAGIPNRDENIEQIYDVTFVGQCHGHYQLLEPRMFRRDIVDFIYGCGIDIRVWGHYWDQPVPFINWEGYANEANSIIQQSKISLNLLNGWAINQPGQIKGRTFEIPQHGIMQISTYADNLTDYFVEDKEIVIARSREELVKKIKYYLENTEEREQIAQAGYNKICNEHLWSHRFDHIFKKVEII